MDPFSEPPSAGNFLERYRAARSGSNPSSPVAKPAAPPGSPPPPAAGTRQQPQPPGSPRSPRSRLSGAAAVWSSVFHPLGRSPTAADRYDLGHGAKSPPGPGSGESVSEIHDLRSNTFSLDQKKEEE